MRAERVKGVEPHTIPHTRLPNTHEHAERDRGGGREREREGPVKSGQCMLVPKGGGVRVQVDERPNACWYA